jgi:hypothetical protein
VKGRDYVVLILALGLGSASAAAVELVLSFATFFPLIHALRSTTGGTLVRIAGFGLSLSRLNRYFAARP